MRCGGDCQDGSSGSTEVMRLVDDNTADVEEAGLPDGGCSQHVK